MRKIYYAAVLLTGACLMTGCKKEQSKQEIMPVKVKTEVIQPRPANGAESFSGTVEEESGTVLSFMTGGTLQRLSVSQGQNKQSLPSELLARVFLTAVFMLLLVVMYLKRWQKQGRT